MKLYLSKVELDGRFALNPYDIHKALWKCFPGLPNERRSFLYRVDWQRPGMPLVVLMQSQLEPKDPSGGDVRFLEPQKVYDTDGMALAPGMTLRFVLCGNPVKRLSKERCRVPLLREEDNLAWLARKMEKAAELSEATIVASRSLHFRRKAEAGKVVTVTFAGVLRVRNADELRSLMIHGVGPAKSFGCGLLSLARV